MNRKNTLLWSVMGLAAGALGAAWLIRRARKSPLPVDAWLPVLSQKHSEDEVRHLLAQAEANYRDLRGHSPVPEHRALRQHLYGSILPGVAIYQALQNSHGGDQQAALDEIKNLFRAWTDQRVANMMRLLRLFPAPLPLFRLGYTMRMSEFPAEGWDLRMIENSRRRIAFDIHSCFYLETLTALGVPELTPGFCQGDDRMGEMLPPSIIFHRTQTLGSGGACCNFRYEFVQRSKRGMP